MASEVMTRDHPDWNKFVELLKTELTKDEPRYKDMPTMWHTFCDGKWTGALTVLMRHFPKASVPETIGYFRATGGFCDCEVLTNCAMTPDERWQAFNEGTRA